MIISLEEKDNNTVVTIKLTAEVAKLLKEGLESATTDVRDMTLEQMRVICLLADKLNQIV